MDKQSLLDFIAEHLASITNADEEGDDTDVFEAVEAFKSAATRLLIDEGYANAAS